MPFEIFIMISAFLGGIAFDYFEIKEKAFFLLKTKKTYEKKVSKINKILCQISIIYLLFKIGFVGGSEVVSQSWQTIIIPSIIVVIMASLWTLLVLLLLNRWSSFGPITQISIATHFGSVSVGTFIAALAFLKAMDIEVNPSVAIWLALMEFPAVLIGMWKLGIRTKTILPILKEEWSLAILPISILLGVLFGEIIPSSFQDIVFGFFFMPMLLYFLFEMGRKASDSLERLKERVWSVLFIGIAIPILGGFFGTSFGYWLGYDTGSIFIMAVLMASASYVLAPLCMQEVLKSIYKPKPEIAKKVVATSMALSLGVTLPFNIAIGFKLYYMMIQGLEASPIFAVFGFLLPFAIAVISFLRPRSKLIDS